MAAFILATGELESMFKDMLDDSFGHCFPTTVIKLMNAMIDSYNRTEDMYLIDDILESTSEPLMDFTPVDDIACIFTAMLESLVDMKGNVATLEYLPENEALIVRTAPRPIPSNINGIREDYHESVAQGDYHPERTRRAIEELLSTAM